MASNYNSKLLMVVSLDSMLIVVASDPQVAKEILNSPHFADRPLIKQSARSLMFSRAIGFAPNYTYWRLFRCIAASHLFAPRHIAAHEHGHQLDCPSMLRNIENDQALNGTISLRLHLQATALINIMGSIFGKHLVPRVRKLVKSIIEEHKLKRNHHVFDDTADFVDVLLSLDADEKLNEDDMIAVLWEYSVYIYIYVYN
ncbi:hypothetical protein BUALT_Bualt11G0010100 [Buddleja alternifolia]|uniref:Cytochrome P450 n=1 Tax=Buddleja alternifolia TaxID=168488 RepID=A0AAV6X2E9_9LAMI|nr:hypothetical protein BUALT_Bualt11G0010100 [Buddleja alternifolia]